MDQFVLRNEIRREQTAYELEHLGDEIVAWLRRRRDGDRGDDGRYVGRHETQLKAIEDTLTGAVTDLRRSLQALDPTTADGDFYDQCRDHDRSVVWLERLWEYFRSKFDQRDDPRLGKLLRAGDEVAWSCYRQVTKRAPRLLGIPVPLLYVEPEYSPAAVQAGMLPYALQEDAEIDVLKAYVQTLPVPIIRLPPWSVDAPWWLVCVAHEVGHHVYHGLDLGPYVREGLRTTAGQNVPANAADEWSLWGEEIFADVFSIMMIGPWAVWALAEMERGSTVEMTKRRDTYPPAVIRISLAIACAEQLGMAVRGDVRALPLEEIARTEPRADRDLKSVSDVLQFFAGPLSNGSSTLSELCDLARTTDAVATGRIGRWAQYLLGKVDQPVDRKLETARQVAAGSLEAWATITGGSATPASRAGARQDLAAKTTETLRRSAEPEPRSALFPKGDRPGGGAALAALLLQTSREQRVQTGT